MFGAIWYIGKKKNKKQKNYRGEKNLVGRVNKNVVQTTSRRKKLGEGEQESSSIKQLTNHIQNLKTGD